MTKDDSPTINNRDDMSRIAACGKQVTHGVRKDAVLFPVLNLPRTSYLVLMNRK